MLRTVPLDCAQVSPDQGVWLSISGGGCSVHIMDRLYIVRRQLEESDTHPGYSYCIMWSCQGIVQPQRGGLYSSGILPRIVHLLLHTIDHALRSCILQEIDHN